jgi:membrane-bound ClpP family serine protease
LKLEVSASALFTVAITLLSLGVSFLKSGDTSTGVICIITGFGLIAIGVYAVEKGIINKIKTFKRGSSKT